MIIAKEKYKDTYIVYIDCAQLSTKEVIAALNEISIPSSVIGAVSCMESQL